MTLQSESGVATRRPVMTGLRKALAASVAMAVLAGCTVRPEPFTLTDHQTRAEQDLAVLRAVQEPVSGPITLYEAMARAVKYNLDQRLKVMEAAFAERQLTTANLDMLPTLAANAGYEGRNKVSASSSKSLTTNRQSLEMSSSQDRHRDVADLGLTWNALDFGVSYVRAQQQADRSLIVSERRRKVIHNIIQDVRAAYWQAASADRLLRRIDPMIERINEALTNARTIEERRLQPPREALAYRRALLDSMRQIKELRRELIGGKANLATLMGLPPGQDFTLAGDSVQMGEPRLSVTLDNVVDNALLYRPELREEAYQTRIGQAEVRAALLSMLPGLRLETAYNYDSNSYALHQNWWSWAAKVNANLLDTFLNGPARVGEARAAKDVASTRRLAISMAVLSQAHVSWLGYHQAVSEFRTANELNEVDRALLEQIRASSDSGRGNDLEVISAEVGSVLAELRRDIAFAQMSNAAGRLYVTAGADPLPPVVEAHDIPTLATAIQATMERWSQGELAPVGAPAPASGATSRPAPDLGAAVPVAVTPIAPLAEDRASGGTVSMSQMMSDSLQVKEPEASVIRAARWWEPSLK